MKYQYKLFHDGSYIILSTYVLYARTIQINFDRQKKMGCSNSDEVHNSAEKHSLIVATLNYGGILNSPLEFFSDSEDEQHHISSTFRQLIPQYVKSFDQKTFKWDVGKIDVKIQKERYTPIYRSKVGFQNNKLIGQTEFNKKWDECYKSAVEKKRIQPQPTSDQIQNMKLFDLICYHTLIKFVYKIKSLNQIETGNFQPKPYISLTQKYFNRSYLNESKKINKVQQALSKHSADVFFFQQPTKDFIAQLKNDKNFFVMEKGADISMLLIKKSSFNKINNQEYLKSVLTEKQLLDLNWDADTCFIVCDNYILISGHLSSKKQKNRIQVEQMKVSLNILRKKCPGYHIIVGADTNSFVTNQGIQSFTSFPNLKDEVTTRKKRTFMQPQFNKGDTINEECKDQIFSTLKILQNQIVTIQNQEIDLEKSSKTLLPTEDHPFDHFMVLCTLQKSI